MTKIGEINIDDIRYTVNADDRAKESMINNNIDAHIIMNTVISICDQLDANVGDDMFIQNEDYNFVLVASIEKEEVNIIALVLDENVIYTDRTTLKDKRNNV